MNKKIVATSMLNMFILITSMAERSLIPLPWMIIWLNGAFGAGKTSCAYELKRRIPNSYVYDPENIGYFIFNNIPNEMKKADFQDYEQWRTFNYSILKDMYRSFSGTIIVPMTIVNPQYYDEIVQCLIDDGIRIKALYSLY